MIRQVQPMTIEQIQEASKKARERMALWPQWLRDMLGVA